MLSQYLIEELMLQNKYFLNILGVFNFFHHLDGKDVKMPNRWLWLDMAHKATVCLSKYSTVFEHKRNIPFRKFFEQTSLFGFRWHNVIIIILMSLLWWEIKKIYDKKDFCCFLEYKSCFALKWNLHITQIQAPQICVSSLI